MDIYTIGLLMLCSCAAAEGCIDISPEEQVFLSRSPSRSPTIIFIGNYHIERILRYFPHYGDNIFPIIPDICPGGVEGLINATKLFPDQYIINLNVSDFYKSNFAYVTQHLAYGGNVEDAGETSQHKVEACVVDFKKTDTKILNITCNETRTTSYPNVKLMSRNVENYPRLLNFVINFPRIEDRYPSITILICDKNEASNENFEFNIVNSKDCGKDIIKYQDNLLAVLTPKPFETDYHTLAPTVLCQAPCYDENIAKNDNYVTLTTCDHYKYALLEFLKHSKWTRVAIVSDNTPYSENFEREMTALLEENGFAYAVARCVETVTEECNFVEALQSLKNADARVFIANVDEMNALRIQKQVQNVWKEENIKCSWILRDFILTGDTEEMGDIYSLSLAPSISRDYFLDDYIHFNGDTEYKSILIEAIRRIRNAYDNIRHEFGVEYNPFNQAFFRSLTENLQMQSLKSGVTAYVKKIDWGTSRTIVKMTVNNNKVSLRQTVDYTLRPDMDINCAMRTRNFHKPCDDNNLLAILVLLVVVAACGLVAVWYTSYIDKNRRAYSNLS